MKLPLLFLVYVVFLTASYLNSNVAAQCTDPGVPSDGYLADPSSPVFPVPSGTSLTFDCIAVGHELFGSAAIICDGSDWDNDLPLCTHLRNVAVMGKNIASTTKAYTWTKPIKSINGIVDQYFLTIVDTDPWWRIDLGGPNDIEIVLITYTTAPYCSSPDNDCHLVGTRLIGAVVRVGMSKTIANNDQCAQVQATPEMFNPIVLQCGQKIRGQYVSVQLENTVSALGFTEIEILGLGVCSTDPGIPDNGYRPDGDPPLPVYQEYSITYACNDGYTMYADPNVECVSGATWNSLPICTDMDNVALDKATEISSNQGGSSSSSVDGDLTTFFLTEFERNPWLRIDLGSLQTVYYVYVFNRPDYGSCNNCRLRWLNMGIFVGNDTDATNNVQCGNTIDENTVILEEITAKCDPPVVARFVIATIETGKSFFNLAEIMVFAPGDLEETTQGPLATTDASANSPTSPNDATGLQPTGTEDGNAAGNTVAAADITLTAGATNTKAPTGPTQGGASRSWPPLTASIGDAAASRSSQDRYLPLLAFLAVIPIGVVIFWFLLRKNKRLSRLLNKQVNDSQTELTERINNKRKNSKIAWPS